jgi:glycosyltransferase involved in cell wall biosynthesis
VTRDVLYFNTWYRGHNNARYAELLPRLERVDARLLTFPRARAARAVGERAWRSVRPGVEPWILRALERHHPYALVTDPVQLGALRVPAVADVDDPTFAPGEAALLRRAAALVVTAESAGRRLEALGVDRPWHVVPQGVALEPLEGAPVTPSGRPTVGYLAAFLLLPGDRGGSNPLYDVTHLLELWDEIARRVPDATLELVGAPGGRLRRRLAGRSDVRLLGRLPRTEVLPAVARWDVALYPRAADQGVRASKVAEYLGAGVPIVSYDYEVVADVAAAGAGLVVASPRDFAAAVERLLRDPAERAKLAAAARAAGADRDWRVLARRYAAIIDRHLPPLH